MEHMAVRGLQCGSLSKEEFREPWLEVGKGPPKDCSEKGRGREGRLCSIRCTLQFCNFVHVQRLFTHRKVSSR